MMIMSRQEKPNTNCKCVLAPERKCRRLTSSWPCIIFVILVGRRFMIVVNREHFALRKEASGYFSRLPSSL